MCAHVFAMCHGCRLWVGGWGEGIVQSLCDDVLNVLACRRQKELVTPVLFAAAESGDCSHLFEYLESGDDVNPLVSYIHLYTHTYVYA